MSHSKVIIQAYRAALERLVESKYDWELTAAHVGRQLKHDDEHEARCVMVARELRRRIEPFRHIEPQWFAEMDSRLYNEFVRRDERNMVLEKARLKRGKGS